MCTRPPHLTSPRRTTNIAGRTVLQVLYQVLSSNIYILYCSCAIPPSFKHTSYVYIPLRTSYVVIRHRRPATNVDHIANEGVKDKERTNGVIGPATNVDHIANEGVKERTNGVIGPATNVDYITNEGGNEGTNRIGGIVTNRRFRCVACGRSPNSCGAGGVCPSPRRQGNRRTCMFSGRTIAWPCYLGQRLGTMVNPPRYSMSSCLAPR